MHMGGSKNCNEKTQKRDKKGLKEMPKIIEYFVSQEVNIAKLFSQEIV